jgi:hypothetical protein
MYIYQKNIYTSNLTNQKLLTNVVLGRVVEEQCVSTSLIVFDSSMLTNVVLGRVVEEQCVSTSLIVFDSSMLTNVVLGRVS